MAFTLSNSTKNTLLNQLTTTLGASPIIRIYDSTGGVPANAEASLGSQVLLGTLTMSATPFPAASAGVLTANAITQDSSADNTGTAAFFRILNSAGTVCYCQGSVGTSGTDMILNSTSIVSGGSISVTALTISI